MIYDCYLVVGVDVIGCINVEGELVVFCANEVEIDVDGKWCWNLLVFDLE